MKKYILIILILCLRLSANSQSKIISELNKRYSQKQYDLIISEHSEKAIDYPAKAVYLIGLAYYMKTENGKCLEFMDLSITKDNTDPDPFFIKGMTLIYLNKPDSAVSEFQEAIKLDPENTKYYTGLGDAFYNQGELEKAVEVYKKAIEKENPEGRPYGMLSHIYARFGDSDNALDMAYQAKNKVSKKSKLYLAVLLNIALIENSKANYNKSAIAYEELLVLKPDDYKTIEKLIQVYYQQQDYEKVKPFKERLYKAYQNGLLEGNLKQEFCFDIFYWNDKEILAHERFEEKEGELFYKHVFYVVNRDSKVDFTIQTENSPISAELGGPKYAIGKNTTEGHATYGFIKEDFSYDNLKEIVFKILNEEMKPTSSTVYGKKVSPSGKKKKKKKKKKK